MDKEQTYEVYKITNNINGLVYIGCTTNGCSFRFHRHLLKARDGESNYPLHKAIREFGEQNFSVSLLEFCKDEKAIVLGTRKNTKGNIVNLTLEETRR